MKNVTSFSIRFPKREERRLRDAALLYGITPDAMARRLIADTADVLLDMPEESFDEYENKQEIVAALKEGLREYRRGSALRVLPKRLRPQS